MKLLSDKHLHSEEAVEDQCEDREDQQQGQHQDLGEFGWQDWCRACQLESQTWIHGERPCACGCVEQQSRDAVGWSE